jgi:small subunit ribosomal protein S20
MAQHRSAEKRHRQSLKRRARNRHNRTTVRRAVARARSAAASGAPDADAQLRQAEVLIRKATSKGVVHAKTASRTVSRLALLLNRTRAGASASA